MSQTTQSSSLPDDSVDFLPKNIEKNGNPYDFELRRGVDCLLRRVLRRTNDRFQGTFRNLPPHEFFRLGFSMLASTDIEFVEELVGGQFPQRLHFDNVFKQKYDRMILLAGDAPVIYGQWLIHGTTKEAMTPHQMLRLADLLEKYLLDIIYRGKVDERFVDDKIAHMIANNVPKHLHPDKWDPKSTTKDISRIAGEDDGAKGKTKYRFTTTRYNKLVELVAAMRARFASISPSSPEYNTPVEIPLCEFGYAADGAKRLRQHESGHSTNYPLFLSRVLLQQEMPQYDIQLHQHVIYAIWDVAHAVVAEVVFTEIGLGYIWEGTGFSHHGAGTNNSSADTTAVKKYNEYKSRLDLNDFKKNLKSFIKTRQDRLVMVNQFNAVKMGEDAPTIAETAKKLEAVKNLKRLDAAVDALTKIRNLEGSQMMLDAGNESDKNVGDEFGEAGTEEEAYAESDEEL